MTPTTTTPTKQNKTPMSIEVLCEFAGAMAEKAVLAQVVRNFEEFEQAGELCARLYNALKEIQAEIDDRLLPLRTRKAEIDNEMRELKAPFQAIICDLEDATRSLSQGRLRWQQEQEAAKRRAILATPVGEASPVAVEPVAKQRTRKVERLTVVDWSAVPDEFLLLNEAAVKLAMKAGQDVPGVAIVVEDVAVRG
jgi:soluble cytochrome b562